MKFVPWIVLLWLKSIRIKVIYPQNFCPGIIGVWHQDLMVACQGFSHKNIHTFISQSKDGDIFTKIVQLLGYRVTRGSDTEGALNVRHLVKSLKENQFVAMALDGPKGPKGIIKPGTLWLSKKTERPLWLVHIEYGKHFTLKGWDSFIIPFPFSKAVVKLNFFGK